MTDFKFNYEFVNGNPRYTGYEYINAYDIGLKVSSFTQTSDNAVYSTTYNPNDTVHLTINGYHTVGFEIHGFTIGASFSDQWHWTLIIN